MDGAKIAVLSVPFSLIASKTFFAYTRQEIPRNTEAEVDARSGTMLLVSIAKRPIQRVSGGLEIIIEENYPFRLRLDSECNPKFPWT